MLAPKALELSVLLAAVLLRVLVGLSSYSGEATPPRFGDYEAQRHWMELTVNLPLKDWYQESVANNISYWPLDYPPLSAYQSWVHGQVLQHFDPQAVELFQSHGYESASSKKVMRASVLVSDMLLFFPAVLCAVRALYGPLPSHPRAFALAATLLNPVLVSIDHGHFQYNCISSGLAVAGAAAIMARRHSLGSVLFCLALNHKQMSLYYAPAFFTHLLGCCFQEKGFWKFGSIIKLGVVVVATFGLAWLPWLTSMETVKQVVQRIFPLQRGLFEDYVANWWCASSAAIKWKQVVPAEQMIQLAAVVTLTGALPSMVHQVAHPSPQGLLLGMANSAASFFMFSYQVHEKSVLLPLLPVTLLAGYQPSAACWMPLISLVSMWPLLVRDGLALPYAGLAFLWLGLLGLWGSQLSVMIMQGDPGTASGPGKGMTGGMAAWAAWWMGCLFAVATVVLHVAQVLVPPPPHLPWLYDRTFITLGFMGLAITMVHLNVAQWALPQCVRVDKQKQQ